MFNPSRLRLARLRLGYTLTNLAEASSVSARTLTDYENGHRSPTRDTLAKLASALAVPITFFERDSIEPVSVNAASFRKLTKTSATRRDAVLARASMALEFFDVVGERFRLPGPEIPTLDKHTPEDAAELVRHRWNLADRPISNMTHLLEAKGVRVASLSQAYDDIDAFCFYRDGIPYVFLNTDKTGERQRFDAAHELGHLVLHSDLDMDPSLSKEREAEANVFASNFLMPKDAVDSQQMHASSIERILVARSYWRVSAMAMTHRLHELKMLTDWQYRSVCISLSERGFRRAEPGGIVPETSQLLRKVMFGSGARVTARDAASILDLSADEIRDYVRHLVPVST